MSTQQESFNSTSPYLKPDLVVLASSSERPELPPVSSSITGATGNKRKILSRQFERSN